MQVNPKMQMFMQVIRNKDNPEQLIMSMLQQQAQGNPMLLNLLELAQAGKTQNIEQIARNMMEAQGVDFDKEFGDFRHLTGL